MKIYLKENVYEAALDRFRWIFSNFENVYICSSGGKDSTVVYELALEVATELNRLPLNVVFIDQEAEWQATIDYIEGVMTDRRVNPFWLQIPIKLFNATSSDEQWLQCWDTENTNWIRDKHDLSIKENIYGTDRFVKLFDKFMEYYHPDESACYISGVRAEESPSRRFGLTGAETYGGVTWGKQINKKKRQFTFYPLYDWYYTDVWKYIHDKDIQYNRIYDYMYQHGYAARDMRVSNVHHETAMTHLFFLQEIEPDTWERITERLSGVNTAARISSTFKRPKKIPFMFDSWEEYRTHLLENLITDEEHKTWYRNRFAHLEQKYPDQIDELIACEISALLVDDYTGTRLANFEARNSGRQVGGRLYKERRKNDRWNRRRENRYNK